MRILFRILKCLNRIQLPLLMSIMLSTALLRRILCFHCLTKTVICLNPYVNFMSILFRILDSLNHIHLPLFMLSKVSIAILKQLLCFYCLTKLIICIKPKVIFISILFRILDSLFVLRKVTIAILKLLLCFHCLTKLIICIKP